MNSTIRQPLSHHNSIDKRENRPETKQDAKPFSFIKPGVSNYQPLTSSNSQLTPQSPIINPQQITKQSKPNCSIQDLETFIKEIDRLQLENQKLKEKTQEPQVVVQQDPKLALENQELKDQLDFHKHKCELQEKGHNDAVRQIDLSWKQDIANLKYQMEQQESKHRQALRQEQQQAKQEIARLQQNLSQISSSDNKNQSLVQALETQLINLKKNNNTLEEKLSYAIQQFDSQSKDQEFTLLKQQAVIGSQEQHVVELKNKLTQQREQNKEVSQQLNKYKDVAETKTASESVLQKKLKLIEGDFEHLSQTYNEHKDSLQSKINELTSMYGKSQEQICLLQQQQTKEQNQIKKLQTSLENQEKNHQNEISDLHKQKQMLIQFLEQELLGYKEQNQQLKLMNQKLETQYKENQQSYQQNFRELECKTNMLGDECTRLNNIIKQKDEQVFRLQVQLKDLMNLNGKNQSQEQILENLQIKEGEINILKQQNDSLISDLSRQAENYRNLVQQHKQLQKQSEEVKMNSITINEFQSKCELQDKEIERLRQKVLEKSQLLEKVQKENLEYQAKLKSKLR
ncbi:unnamed protein product (macronuclear) [Paramecium tetraurelia]|uniref:Uncharacterized protein n=1 Tax=Paramecium tetraurelia TaxID=5888 RepID=A0EFK8_PARTE|nr:uncharacterized protein GSPATT00026422001 [Paramecium tetraurelia]CAK94099.1 unnamed protein product [Paramecium tetraurelia]|eukprot:XP_001461472.1 hypothetical protein (macronuclear) [Paramecium tetraurelia strain d4-2]